MNEISQLSVNVPRERSRLRIIHLEDDDNDAELVRRLLQTEGFQADIVRVQNQHEFEQALADGGHDLILSDHTVPGYNGKTALTTIRAKCASMPFIFVSGTLGEEAAIESLREGATDYVLKHRLDRLGPAVRRALREREEQMKRMHAEENLRRSARELEKINNDLLRRNQEIQSFYHTLSHELKTPLTSAREFISIVLEGLAGPLAPKQLEYLRIAKESCNQLRLLLNDLLDTTRLETGKLRIEPKATSLEALIHDVVSMLSPAVTSKRIYLSTRIQPGLPTVEIDESRIRQVLINLLNNALKYTPPEGRIALEVTEAPERPDWLRISVSDSGSGIPADQIDRIFDRLYQVTMDRVPLEQGMGLGLYISKQLVELHGGRIWVESEWGKGSTFTFEIPRNDTVQILASQCRHSVAELKAAA